MTEAPRLSAAVVNWNTRDLLRRCLAALRREARELALETIVVDNGSRDGSAAMVAAEFPEVRLLVNPESRGFAAGCNQALALARGEYWALVAPDAEPKPGALAILVRELEAHPEAGAAGPQLLNTDGSLQPSGRRRPALGRAWLEGLLPSRAKAGAWWQKRVYGRSDFSRPAVVDEVSGACFVARREAFAKAGMFDERFFIYYEEVDWFRRLAALGWRVRYQPAAQVFHHWGAGMAQMRGEAMLIHHRSAFAYWRKHAGRGGELAARAAAVSHVLAWSAGFLVLALLGRRRWRDLAEARRGWGRVLGLALGLRR